MGRRRVVASGSKDKPLRTASNAPARRTASSAARSGQASVRRAAGSTNASDASFVDARRLDPPMPVADQIAVDAATKQGLFADSPDPDAELKSQAARNAAARKSARRSIRNKAAAIGVGAVAAVCVAAWALLFAPWCRVAASSIDVTGTNQWVSAQTVERKAQSAVGKPVLLVSASALSNSLEQIPGVDHVSISRSLFNRLKIAVSPADPQAVLKGPDGSMTVVDKDGRTIGTTNQEIPGVPTIAVDEPGSQIHSASVKLALSVLSQIPSSLHSQLMAVTAMSADSVSTSTENGYTIVWGDASDMYLKCDIVEHLIYARGGIEGYKTINVANPKRPTVSNNGSNAEIPSGTSSHMTFNQLMSQ